VVPRKEVAIKPQVSGIIETLYVQPGDKVKDGDLVAKIRIIPDMVTLNNAENRVSMARIRLQNSERELKRNRELLAEGVVSEAVFRQFELEQASARQELEAAQDNLELIRKGTTEKSGTTSNTLVRATIRGMVLEVPLEEGDSVIESNTFNEGTTIASIADMDELVFDGKVDESEVGKIRTGMTLVLTIGAVEGATFEAELEHIAPKGVEENGAIQFEVRAALKKNDDFVIRANYSASADIVLDRRDEVMAINENLLQFDGDKPYVEVETNPQSFEKRFIETGLSDGIHIEIVSGLSPEERIKDPNSGA
jgi:HlyD family secretion protein